MHSLKKIFRVIDVLKNLLVKRLDKKAEPFVEHTQVEYIQVYLNHYPRRKGYNGEKNLHLFGNIIYRG